MASSTSKDAMIGFLLQLLKEEREKRKQAETEVEVLKTILEPLQQKELDKYREKRETAIRKIREDYYKKQPHKHRDIVCDCFSGTEDGESDNDLDIIDSLSSKRSVTPQLCNTSTQAPDG